MQKKSNESEPSEPMARLSVEIGDVDRDGRFDVAVVAQHKQTRVVLFKENLDYLDAIALALDGAGTFMPVIEGLLATVLGKRAAKAKPVGGIIPGLPGGFATSPFSHR